MNVSSAEVERAKSQLKAGSTILVPKISSSSHSGIAENIIDNAVVAFEAERSGAKRSSSRFKAKADAGKSKRIARNTSSQRKHR